MNRRQLLKRAVAGTLTLWTQPLFGALRQTAGGSTRLSDKLIVLDSGGSNVVALSEAGNLLLVDTGAPNSGATLSAALRNFAPGAAVRTVFNTHYHPDQTGNNEMFGAAGTAIVAHERTLQWMAADYWVPELDRYEKARPKAAQPTQTFLDDGSMEFGAEPIEYGYLALAHTSGDIYVFFADSNVVAAGDVASPVRDPALDFFTGAWIGGRVDAMDRLLKLSDDETRFVPSYGPVMTRSEFQTERDMMEEIRVRLFTQVREGDGPQDMLEADVLKGLPRTWRNPYKFLYDAAKGLWAHHNKIDANVV